jgi:type VI secretion system protein ImpJ
VSDSLVHLEHRPEKRSPALGTNYAESKIWSIAPVRVFGPMLRGALGERAAMSWRNKVIWTEGLFLRPHHLQQHDRYVEGLVESRTRNVTPYPWGFSSLEIDRDLAQQSRFAVRRAAGIMPDGTPFDIPAEMPPPPPIEVPESAGKYLVWLTLPVGAPNTREVESAEADSASRFVPANVRLIDTTSALRIEEEIEVAQPRLAYELRKTAKPGYVALAIARIVEVRDRAIVFDETFAPPVLTSSSHPVVHGWIERVIGWVENKLEELARYAADPTAGGGLQSADYFILQLLNRHIPVLQHFAASRFVHPERLPTRPTITTT